MTTNHNTQAAAAATHYSDVIPEEECQGHPAPHLESTPVIACICGSTSQRRQMNDLNRRLTMHGKVVLAPGVFQHDGDPLTDHDKARLDELHLRKIDMADEVHFIHKPDGSLGSSTTKELEYAQAVSKHVDHHYPDRKEAQDNAS